MNTRIASFVAFVGLSFGAAALAPAASYKVDPVHSFVNFKVSHLGVGYVWGRFDAPEGSFNTDEGKEAFEAKVATDKIDTGVAKRDQHLKSPDFFNAKQFPELTFKSTGVKKSGENQYEVNGDMTVHGVTKSITVNLTKTGEAKTQMGERAGFDGSFTIKRSDFGMSFMPGAVGDEITVYVDMEGTKE